MDLLYHRKIDASVLEAVADDMHYLQEDNLIGFLPPQLATVNEGRGNHSRSPNFRSDRRAHV